jgi:hypothetical protein
MKNAAEAAMASEMNMESNKAESRAEIEREINLACARGMRSVSLHGVYAKSLAEELENMGYEVTLDQQTPCIALSW